MDHTLVTQDPPEHTRLRTMGARCLSAARAKDLEPAIERFVDKLIARIREQGEADFVADFALPLPLFVIAELLGIPAGDRPMFGVWSRQIILGYDSLVADEEILNQQQDALRNLLEYFNRLVEVRRQEPCGDLISTLVGFKEGEGGVSSNEILGMCALLLIAGHETSTSLLSTGMLTLMQHPEQCEAISGQPDLLPTAIEEMLRYESPLQRATFRVTAEPCEIGGKRFQAGEQVCAVIGAANRDPERFHLPETFDITRAPNRHLAFGLGIHACLGATLARTEARIAFRRILDSLPRMRLVSEEPDWSESAFIRRLRSLPVAV